MDFPLDTRGKNRYNLVMRYAKFGYATFPLMGEFSLIGITESRSGRCVGFNLARNNLDNRFFGQSGVSSGLSIPSDLVSPSQPCAFFS